MKKLIMGLALATCAMTGFAQEDLPEQKYSVATNSFFSNWFVQVGADWNAFYSNEEHGLGLSHSPFKKFRANPGASIALGKWFTPGIGLRTKFQGIWGKAVVNDQTKGNHNKYLIINEQVLFNLSNLFCGYNPNRVWNVIPFVGAGLGRNMSDNINVVDLNVGLQSSWRLGKKVDVYVEAGWNRLGQAFDGVTAVKGSSNYDGVWERKDNNLYAEVGFTFRLGKSGWSKTPDVEALNALNQSQLDALNSQLEDANAENERLRGELEAKQSNQTSSVVYKSAPVSVFFNIGKTKIASSKDMVNLESFAKSAKENNNKILVTGYADSKTGSAEYNQKLSQSRADAVVEALVKFGIDKSMITTQAKGGVDDLSPVDNNRRATVEIQ
ncbi:OmpA family protein [Segatella bryantii]|uniref:Cell envelope biogenesis protein OmpA n=1 Tax=Segatella bryantii TaxID=77095 RepID=A0ABX4EHH3_SEGBR|nr:OmpA family protein [Segatella bryantii]MDR4930732.1 OmpA family protein [Segatella bryantii]OYP53496.1 cell envelope biogenesis protein OmpA [Segatella bryantii]UKK76872.1 OmpA family protein [Segatella bryantii]UKK81508.1 OmpA family protein [Segatella bryantii]